MSEYYYVRPDGRYCMILYGCTLVCTVWSDEYGAQQLCDVLNSPHTGDSQVHEVYRAMVERLLAGRQGTYTGVHR